LRRLRVALGALSLAAGLGAPDARATYSIAAVDLAARTLGGAGTSCVGGQDVAVIYKAAPRYGVVLGQAQYDPTTHQRALELLAGGLAPDAVLADVTSPSVDARSSVRQYAIVDVTGRVAAFTGADTGEWAGDRQGRAGQRVYSVQGNILTGEDVVKNAALSFQDPACDLAEQLLLALEAGAQNGQGDRRCTPGTPADSAFLTVESIETGATVVDLRVPTSGTEDPLDLLRQKFEQYRAAHPCAPPPVAAESSKSGGCSLGARGVLSPAWLLALAVAALGRRSAKLRRAWRSPTS